MIVLDHYYLYLKNNCYAVVVGNTHSNNFIVGYVKYCVSNRETIWCSKHYCYDRYVKYYDRSEIYNYTPWRILSPCYGSEIPIIPLSTVSEIHDPRLRTREILTRTRDELEKTALNLLLDLGSNTDLNNIGLTGTLLVGIHNVKYSDIDIVVYGLRESIDTIEFINENPSVFKNPGNDWLREWCIRVSKATGVDPFTVSKLYRRWRRGLYQNREYSVIYNDNVYKHIDNCEKWLSIGVSEGLVELEGSTSALNYPSTGVISRFKHTGGLKPGSDPEYILSFEALYTPLFYEGGRGYVRAILQYNPLKDTNRLLVGVHEEKTYIKIPG